MAMYRHVRERKDLLEAVVDRLMGSLSSKPSVPWLRPPLRSVEAVDPFLATLIGLGFGDEQAVAVARRSG